MHHTLDRIGEAQLTVVVMRGDCDWVIISCPVSYPQWVSGVQDIDELHVGQQTFPWKVSISTAVGNSRSQKELESSHSVCFVFKWIGKGEQL